ncbi:MAG: HAMP domain-containing sensor histidine kinase, partial [Actinobacteria bacterium]|nr:HAMP domain-containing sensor histidine kinase [Actinomycetota bacterium]
LMDGVIQPTDEVFAAIADEAARLKRLAFDLSTLSKVQEGPSIDLRPVDLAAQVRDVVDLLQHQFDPKGVRLQLEIERPVEISADTDRITQILTNVIGNALAFTEDGGTVSVRVLSDGPWAVVRIADTGRGIAEADLEHIFERFFRIDDRSSSTGTGVGLTIARSLARAHGGDITASSPGLGQGSVFELRLPAG